MYACCVEELVFWTNLTHSTQIMLLMANLSLTSPANPRGAVHGKCFFPLKNLNFLYNVILIIAVHVFISDWFLLFALFIHLSFSVNGLKEEMLPIVWDRMR